MYLLGVDGGGSKTLALLTNERGQVIGSGRGGVSSYHRVGIVQAMANVKRAVESALEGRSVGSICCCLAAADSPEDFEMLRIGLSFLDIVSPPEIRNDLIAVFRAGSRFPYGVGVVCGTGFNAGGISKTGEEFRLPAMGEITGDRSGSDYIGPLLLGDAFRAWDGRGEPTMLTDMVLQALDAPDFVTVAERYSRGKLTEFEIGALVPLAFEASEAGDTVARQIITGQGVELGRSAIAILRRLQLVDEDCDVVLGGSVVYGKGDLLMNTVRETVQAVAPNSVVKRLDVPPVVGAVFLAADRIGVGIDADFHAAVRATLPGDMRVSYTT